MLSYVTILHVYNEEEHLETVIKAIKEQTIPPSEIFIVDDGSTDKTSEIIHNLNLPHIHKMPNVKQPAYKRRAHAFNDAVDLAVKLSPSSDYLLKVDGDTKIESRYVEVLLTHMGTNIIAACSGISTEYFKTRDLNNGAVLYRIRTLPRAREMYGWDRNIQLELIRAGYMFHVDTSVSYTDLRPPGTLKPSLKRVVVNRANRAISEIIGKTRRKHVE